MARIFITGSADGLGQMAAARLIEGGHEVVLHARNAQRARDAAEATPGAAGLLVGDLGSLRETRALAEAANAQGSFDAVIHNAGIGYREPRRTLTEDGLEHVFQINVLAAYVLTAAMERPARLVYMSSGMHRGGEIRLDDLQWEHRRWNGAQAYSDSKLLDVVLAFAVARRWPDVQSSSVDPGWVATKMGGAGAPHDLAAGSDTQAWIASGDAPTDLVAGRHLYHRRPAETHPAARDPEVQDGLLAACAEVSGVELLA